MVHDDELDLTTEEGTGIREDEDSGDEAEKEGLPNGEGREMSNGVEYDKGGSTSIDGSDAPSGSDSVTLGGADSGAGGLGDSMGTDERGDGPITGAVRVDLVVEHAPVHSKSPPPVCID